MDELRSERPFRLTEIHASAAEKLKELESTLRGGIAEHFVWFFYRTDNQSQLLALVEDQAHAWVERADQVYRLCLRDVGREESPAILASIWDKGLSFFITGTVRELILESCGINEELRSVAEIDLLQFRSGLPEMMVLHRTINEVDRVVKKIHDEWQMRLSPSVKDDPATKPTPPSNLRRPAEPTKSKPRVETADTTAHQQNSDPKKKAGLLSRMEKPGKYDAFRTAEAACILNVSTETVNRWARKGKLTRGAKRGTILISSVNRTRKRKKNPS
jgi:hypothetical protein